MKAFLVNRVGDFGFLLGIGMVAGLLRRHAHYADVFAAWPGLATKTVQIFPWRRWSLMTVTCILLFIGAMGKSAQCRCTSGCRTRWKADPDFRL